MRFDERTKMTFAISLLIILVANILTLLAMNVHLPAVAEKGVHLMIVVDSSCEQCSPVDTYQSELEQLGVVFDDVKTVERDSRAGKKALETYGLTRLPSLLFSEELADYPVVVGAWERVGSIADDGTYILSGAVPPFYDLEQRRVRGLVSLINIVDPSCDECYDVSLHQQLLERYGMVFTDVRTLDATDGEGGLLVSRYGITGVPTVIIEGEPSLYLAFAQVASSIGRFEGETFLFTNLDAIGEPYKDLTSGLIIRPGG